MAETGSQQVVNEVRLAGRLARQVDERTLPSGDVITTFAIIVDRPQRRGSARVDTIACVTSRRSVATAAGQWPAGQWVEAEGALRRRFWRSGAGLGSATEVEVHRMRKLRDA
jgi:single-strand DNA-binding protein